MKFLVRGRLYRAWRAYRLRIKRRYFIARAIVRRRQLDVVCDNTHAINPNDILLISVVKDEMPRIAHFLEYHRSRGVHHFLFVDNNSSDGTKAYLRKQSDVSLWHTKESYKASRFGVDWSNWLLLRYGRGHWCLTLDADELFLAPHDETKSLRDLTSWLDSVGACSMGAFMIDLYSQNPVSQTTLGPKQNPLDLLQWFDAHNYSTIPRPELNSGITHGGVRLRKFFADDPSRAPTMNKVPLVKWHWRYAYLTSTHVILPPRLNEVARSHAVELPTAALLHTKFLSQIAEKAQQKAYREAHFSNSDAYVDYYDALSGGPVLWDGQSTKFQGWAQLCELGLMNKGDWIE